MRKVIYTVCTGEYDHIRNLPEIFKADWDSFLITDDQTIDTDYYNGWNVIQIDKSLFMDLPNVAIAKYFKINQGYPYINDYDYTLYIDSNREVKKDLNDFLEIFHNSNFLIGTHPNDVYRNIYKEIQNCKTHGRDYLEHLDEKLDLQYKAYKEEGIPKEAGDRIESGVILRTNTIKNKIINSLWWSEFYKRGTWRDQLALRYVQYKNNLGLDLVARNILCSSSKSVYKGQFFCKNAHKEMDADKKEKLIKSIELKKEKKKSKKDKDKDKLNIISVVFESPQHEKDYIRLSKVFKASTQHYNPNANVNIYELKSLKSHIPESIKLDIGSESIEENKDRKFGFYANTCKLNKWIDLITDMKDGSQIIYCDVDMLCRGDMSYAFDKDFDLAYTVRDTKSDGKLPFNGGVIFIRKNDKSIKFLKKWKEINQKMYEDIIFHNDYKKIYGGMNQSSFGYMLENYKDILNIKELPCEIYNSCNNTWHTAMEKAKMIHIKSNLRRLVLGKKTIKTKEKYLEDIINEWKKWEDNLK